MLIRSGIAMSCRLSFLLSVFLRSINSPICKLFSALSVLLFMLHSNVLYTLWLIVQVFGTKICVDKPYLVDIFSGVAYRFKYCVEGILPFEKFITEYVCFEEDCFCAVFVVRGIRSGGFRPFCIS